MGSNSESVWYGAPPAPESMGEQDEDLEMLEGDDFPDNL